MNNKITQPVNNEYGDYEKTRKTFMEKCQEEKEKFRITTK